MARLGVISPYPEFSEFARDVAAELGIAVEVREAILDRAVAVGREWQSARAVDAVVARGPTAIMLRKRVTMPVETIPIGAYDVLEALGRARDLGRRILFVDFDWDARPYRFEDLRRMLRVDFEPLLYRSMFGLGRRLVQVQRSGADVVVGTGVCIVGLAERAGMHGVLVRTPREALKVAFQTALARLHEERAERSRAKLAQTVLDLSHNGILVADRDGRVIVFNAAAERMLDLPAPAVLGRPLVEVLRDPRLAAIHRDGSETMGELISAAGMQFVVNRMSIRAGGEPAGVVLTFQPLSQFLGIEERLRRELYQKGLAARYSFADIAGDSEPIRAARETAGRYAGTDLTVLISGESGTGKELFAHAVHAAGARARGPFVAVNCAALPESLLESELFGYEEGAFTGARKGGKPGLFELARRGTIFLDEIGDLSPPLQARLLRVLQEREVMRVGGDRITPVDVRVIAATNRDLDADVRAGRFRQDLYYRVSVLRLTLPPLRDRTADLVPLGRRILQTRAGRPLDAEGLLPESAAAILARHDWPGNVRELENFLHRYALSVGVGGGDPLATLGRLMGEHRGETSPGPALGGDGDLNPEHLVVRVGTLEEMVRQILAQLDADGAARATLARRLGISRTTLWKKLREAGLNRPAHLTRTFQN